MAMNDFFRFKRTPLGLDITVGGAVFGIRGDGLGSGYVILPQQPQAAEASTEVGSKWNRAEDGSNQQRDSAGVRVD